MPNWAGSSIWKKHRALLMQATGRDFERRALAWLHARWPDLVQTAALRTWDARGIDGLALGKTSPFECVVQCKAFEEFSLGESQVRQAVASIDRFADSGLRTQTYVLLHNRDGRFGAFNRDVKAALARLQATGRVAEAHLWDVNALLLAAYTAMEGALGRALRRRSDRLLSEFQSRLRFGTVHVSTVPVAEARIHLVRNEPARLEPVTAPSIRAVQDELLEPSPVRWTMVTGWFGAGKTTLVLTAAHVSARTTIVVPAVLLPDREIAVSTTTLLEEATKATGLLDDFLPEDRYVLDEIAGVVLGSLLKRNDTPYALVIDGLDENRLYCRLDGLQQLSNQLSDLRCPIVLTTRTEHFFSMFGQFQNAFALISRKGRSSQPVRVLRLEPWSQPLVLQLIDQVHGATRLRAAEARRLAEFRALVEHGRASGLYGELPQHPLFLQFILEDVLADGVRASSRSDLIRRWIGRKIRRDWEPWVTGAVSRRPTLAVDMDLNEVVDRMLRVLELVAADMTVRHGDTVELREWLDGEQIEDIAQSQFCLPDMRVRDVLLNSVLVPLHARQGATLRIGFVFRILQEYFLAAHLVHHETLPHGYPTTVRDLCDEIRGGNPAIDIA